jgi:hypothetical protein
LDLQEINGLTYSTSHPIRSLLPFTVKTEQKFFFSFVLFFNDTALTLQVVDGSKYVIWLSLSLNCKVKWCVSTCTRTYLHIVASWAEPLKEEDCEGGDLNGGKGDEQPRCRVKRLC